MPRGHAIARISRPLMAPRRPATVRPLRPDADPPRRRISPRTESGVRPKVIPLPVPDQFPPAACNDGFDEEVTADLTRDPRHED